MNLKNIRFIFYFVGLLWVVHIVNWILPIDLRAFGLVPRTGWGLVGILTSPFIHGSLIHLINNSISFLILGSVLVVFFEKQAVNVIVITILLGGGLLWLFGRSSVHIGVSGLIYGIATFLITAGWFSKKFLPIVISLVIGFSYGFTLLFGVLPLNPYISWEGHLFGGIAGVVAAKILQTKNQSNENREEIS